MKSQSTTPGMIAFFGLVAVGILGFIVSSTTERQPILKLRPALEKRLGVRGWKCVLKFEERRIEVTPPAALPTDRISRRRLGSLALETYIDLTKGQTSIEAALVLPPKGTSFPVEEVTRFQSETAQTIEGHVDAMARDASIAAGASASIVGVAPALNGAAVYVTLARAGNGAAGDARAAGEKILAAQRPLVTYVRVDAAPAGSYEAGSDVASLASTTAGAVR